MSGAKTPHLLALVTVLVIVLTALVGFNGYARHLEQGDVNALAPLELPVALNGSALQQAALTRSDFLPLFGSSELALVDSPYEAKKFFGSYPTGFTVFQVANLGAGSLTMAQDLAALGPDLRGKKVVISITPAPFTFSSLTDDYYAGNFSRLHAYGLIFSPVLTFEVKREAARRMLDYPKTLQRDAFLQLVVTQMAPPSAGGQILYALLWPLGALQSEILRLQDHAEVLLYIRDHPVDPFVRHVPAQIPWAADFSAASADQKLHVTTNPYGIEDWRWNLFQGRSQVPYAPGSGDAAFLQFLQTAQEWPDLDLLLQVLHQLGAQPLILSRPINAGFWEAVGVSSQAQSSYYVKLHAVVDPYHMTLVDYQQYGSEIYFSIDNAGHTSRYGWVFVDQTLDDFFHGALR